MAKNNNYNENEYGKKKSGKWWILILVLFLVLAIAVVISVFVIRSKNKDTSDEITGTDIVDEIQEFNTLTGKVSDTIVNDEKSAIEVAKEAADNLGLGNAADELSVDYVKEMEKTTYYRLQQNYNGIPVYGRTMVVVADKNGQAIGYTGNSIEIEKIDLNPNVDENKIKEAVEDYLKTECGYDSISNIVLCDDFENNKYIYNLDEGMDSILMWRTNVTFEYAGDTLAITLLIDVTNSNVIQSETSIYQESAVCYGKNQKDYRFNGLRKTDGTYMMKDVDRNIYIYNADKKEMFYRDDNKIIQAYNDRALSVSSVDEYFGNEDDEGKEYDKAIKLLKNISKIYDFFNKSYGEKGVEQLVAIYNDTFDDGTNALGGTIELNTLLSQGLPEGEIGKRFVGVVSLGTSFSKNISQFLDVVGHEYTHFVTSSNVGWTSSPIGFEDEIGAIMEGYSDIFGEIIEGNIKKKKINWIMGNNEVIRNIQKPSDSGNPEKISDIDSANIEIINGNVWYSNTDYSHYASTIVSHCAYLMNNGVNGSCEALTVKELSDLWYETIFTLPSNCTYSVLRKNMEMTALNIGLSEEKRACVSTAFDTVGIQKQESAQGYAPDSTLQIIDKNGDVYDDYTVKIKGFLYDDTDKLNNNLTYENEIKVTDKTPVALELKKGIYGISVTDNFNKEQSVYKFVHIHEQYKKEEIVLATDFGFDFVVKPNAEMVVNDYKHNPYYNYTVQVDGTSQSTFTVDNESASKLNLTQGKYSFILTDNADSQNTKKFSLKVAVTGATKFEVDTDFGKSNAQDDFSLVPNDAYEFNGHYYYIYSESSVTTYAQAKQFCEDKKGYLATLTSDEENNNVYDYMIDKGYHNAYFGLTDEAEEGTWVWINGEESEYRNWHDGEPNNQGKVEDYAMFYSGFGDSKWNDGDFSNKSAGDVNAFICEWGNYDTPSNDVNKPSKRVSSGERSIVLSLDSSGSMDGYPMEQTIAASENFIDTVLNEDANIGIVTYESYAEIVSDFSVDNEALKNALLNIYSYGGTNIEQGLIEAYSMLQNVSSKKKIIVLMSDGLPNEGSVDEELVEVADTIKSQGVIIYTLGFFSNLGDEKAYAQSLLEKIASPGLHFEVDSAENLTFFFNDVANQVNDKKYVYIKIACPVDVTVTSGGETLSSNAESENTRTSFGSLTYEDIQNGEEQQYYYDDDGTAWIIQNGVDVSNSEEVDVREDKAKILRLDMEQDYDIEISGYDSGTMDCTISYPDENGEYTDVREFPNITVTSTTKATANTALSEASYLKVDSDGDGDYETTYKTESNGTMEEVQEKKSHLVLFICIGVGVVIVIVTIIIIVAVNKSKKRRKVYGVIVGLFGGFEGQQYVIHVGETCIIGRQSDCDICIMHRNSKISRHHCMVQLMPTGQYRVTDYSSNGTYNGSNNQKLPKRIACVLPKGSLLVLGTPDNVIELR